MIRLSIITINYNNLEGLKRTYDSVVAQTCQDFEWIIIDGGSTDGSRDFIVEHKDRIAYWCSEPDKGVYHAMNKGVAKATGDYLNFMNSGDCFYDKHTLQCFISQEPVADLVYGDWIRIYPDHEVLKAAPRKAFFATVFFENVCHQAMFIKAEVLKKKGYDEEMMILADWKRWIELSIEGLSFQYIPHIICRFEAGKGLSETNTKQIADERNKIYTCMPEVIETHFRKYNELILMQWECMHNPIISETIRVSLQGSSYKTKLIHFTLLLVRFIEKFI